jgi:hypothetical protein
LAAYHELHGRAEVVAARLDQALTPTSSRGTADLARVEGHAKAMEMMRELRQCGEDINESVKHYFKGFDPTLA